MIDGRRAKMVDRQKIKRKTFNTPQRDPFPTVFAWHLLQKKSCFDWESLNNFANGCSCPYLCMRGILQNET